MNYQTLSDAELTTALELAGRYPAQELIQECLDRQASLTPFLLMLFEESLSDFWDDEDNPRWYRMAHFGKLLIAYREPAALPIFASLFKSLDPDEQDILEWFETDLAHYGPAAIPMLTDVLHLDTGGEYHYGRSLACETLGHIAYHHPEAREEILASMRALLPPLNADGTLDLRHGQHDDIWEHLPVPLGDLQDQASRAQIEALFQEQAIDGILTSLKHYQTSVTAAAPDPRFFSHRFDILDYYEDRRQREKRAEAKAGRQALLRQQGFTPPLTLPPLKENRLNQWVNKKMVGQPTKSKIGRNEPCPCGSGKKFKQCHGKQGAPPLH